ncbi:diadenylate cyclase [Desulfoglaeba alkanexedens]|jgi:uncharacterized protein (TIGR00159 family)|uniref:Diadenylate cyclase n=1 Tax=Desulfoglaeba alkanexedens ALDC TaxID=980445 RepID=A0A4P8L3T7_9BACT|nr:diadenylate cyclase [Desulfoglaeba alkanexedens]QCQ22444.1 DisA protein [Desulfoglaeba alkanexedens ALDC]
MSQFWAFIGSIRWQDLVDITFNSYVLFRLYVLFRNTNAFRILAGIASVWLVQEMAASLGLILTSWALQAITAAAAIIIIVVFRNEIRSVLQARNFKAFFWGSPLRETPTPIETIVDTVFQMGKKRIGALIVIPGKEDLRELVHGGIPWNGTVSPEMLMSIFWPNNPVHDGAIVIQGNRVVEVGVLLPLSQRQDLPTFYGTRHRAAAGLAERTDALVIAVSEERGRVTVAKDNWIKPILQPEDLAHLLQEHLNISKDDGGDKQRRERTRLVVAALLSFIVMTGIWFGFTRSRDTLIALSVPIEYVNRPFQYQILETSVTEVHLQLHGSSALLKSLKPEQVAVRVSLAKAEEGRNVFPITQENIILPPGVFLHSVNPATVEVVLDTPASKVVPVQVDWTGRLPEGLILSEMAVEPEKVEVMGGKTLLESIHTLYTAPVRLDNLSRSGTLSAGIILSPSSLKLAPGTSDTVTIRYIVSEKAPNPSP